MGVRSRLYGGYGTVRMPHFSENLAMVCTTCGSALRGCRKISSTFLLEHFLSEMGDHFLPNCLIVHSCNGVTLMSCVLIRKTLFIKKKNYHHNLSSVTNNFGFFLGLARSRFSIVNSVVLIPGCNETSRTHPQLSHCKIQPLPPLETTYITCFIQQHDVPFVLV